MDNVEELHNQTNQILRQKWRNTLYLLVSNKYGSRGNLVIAGIYAAKKPILILILVRYRGSVQGFFPGGTGGVPHPVKILPIPPPSDTCPRFWTKACPPQPRFVPENLKNLNTFLCQI